MNEPKRLLAGGGTEFERILLGAAGREEPTQKQRRRMQRALIGAQFGILATSAKALAAVSNNVVIVAVVAASLAGATSSIVVAPPIPDAKPEVAVPGLRETSPTPIVSVVEQLPLAQDEPMAPNRAKPEVLARRPPDLRDEIALMDQARTALRLGAPGRALATLEQYRSRFPRGSFGQEAAVLRVESLQASGRSARAKAEAGDFLARHPNSPHAERLRQVVRETSSSPR
jgi:hypothetical protein